MTPRVFKTIKVSSAPQTGAPLSAVVQVDDTLYLSGLLGFARRGSPKLVTGGIKAQTDMIFQYIKSILEECGSTLEKIVTVRIFLDDISDGPVVNEIYQKYLKPPYPARCMMQVAKLPFGAKIEIEVMALVGDKCKL